MGAKPEARQSLLSIPFSIKPWQNNFFKVLAVEVRPTPVLLAIIEHVCQVPGYSSKTRNTSSCPILALGKRAEKVNRNPPARHQARTLFYPPGGTLRLGMIRFPPSAHNWQLCENTSCLHTAKRIRPIPNSIIPSTIHASRKALSSQDNLIIPFYLSQSRTGSHTL